MLPDGTTGLVTNEAAGTLSILDLAGGVKLADVTVGPPLSHPQGVVVDHAGTRAYVALSNSDEVVVVNLEKRSVERTISVGRSSGLGTMPVAVALSPAEDRLYVAEAGGDEIAVIRLPGEIDPRRARWTVVGRIPIADDPQAVATVPARNGRPAQLMWVAAKGVDVGPNPNGPNPVIYSDPIFWAFNPVPPTTDVFDSVGYTAALIRGRAGLMSMPSDAQVERLTPAAARQLQPVGATAFTGRHAVARRRTDQARLLHRAREPELRPAAGRRRPRQRRPEAERVRQVRDAQPALDRRRGSR